MGKNKIFFITLTQEDIKRNFGLSNFRQNENLRNILIKKEKNYVISVYSMEYKPYSIEENSKDKITGKYQINQMFLYEKKSITINFLIDKTRDNFIYNFKYNNYRKNANLSIKDLNIIRQFEIFNESLEEKKEKNKGLFIDSNIMLNEETNPENYFHFYLKLLNYYFYTEYANSLLEIFNLNILENYKEFDEKKKIYYGRILSNLEEKIMMENSNLSLSTQFRDVKTQSFIKLLFIYRAKFEKNKLQEMLDKQSFWNYYAEIIVQNLQYYLNLEIILPKGLITKILSKTKFLTIELMNILLSFSQSIKDLLFMINKNFDSIFILCIKNKYKINVEEFKKQKSTDDLKEIEIELDALLKNELKVKFNFVIFNEKFWFFYFDYYKNLGDFKSLRYIEYLIISKKLYNNVNIEKISKMIHETEFEIIKSGKLKNEKLLEFFENNYFKETNNNFIFHMAYLDGIDLNSANDKFFDKWNQLKILSYLSDSQYQKIIDTINEIENFGKLFILFKKINEINIIKQKAIVSYLIGKYEKLLQEINIENYKNLIYDSSHLIYLIDLSGQNSIFFMKNIIMPTIKSTEIIISIYYNVLSKYQNISYNLIGFIIIYLIKNKNLLNNDILFCVQSYLNYNEIICIIFKELNNVIIKEEDFFREEKEIYFFTLYKSIQEFIDCSIFKETNYLSRINQLKNNIINNLIEGNYTFNLIYSWFNDKEKKDLLKNRLSILLMNNKNEINNIFKSIEKYFIKINENLIYLKILSGVLKKFFPKTQENNIEYLDNIQDNIKNGLLKEVNYISIKIDKTNFIKDLDLYDMDKLKISKLFVHIYENKKLNNSEIDEIEIFKKTKEEFNKLKNLFNDDWLENNIIENYSNIIKNIPDYELEKELFFLKEYFGLKNINDSYIINLKENIISLIKRREEVLQDINNCFLFILEFIPKETKYFSVLSKTREKVPKKMNLDKLKNYKNYVQKYISDIYKRINEEKISELESKQQIILEENRYLNSENKKLKKKEDEFEQIKNQLGFDLKEGEKIMTINFTSIDQKFHCSFICKNTDIFSTLEIKLYSKYEEYKDKDTYFMSNSIRINKNLSLEENNIKDNAIIILNEIEYD